MQLSQLYKRHFGAEPTSEQPLTPAGSARRYYRLAAEDGSRSVVGCIGTDLAENRAFISLTADFVKAGLPVPEVLEVSDDGREYLVSDLGDEALFGLLDREDLLEKAILMLRRFHTSGTTAVDRSHFYNFTEFDSSGAMLDLHYFKYNYLNVAGIAYAEHLLEQSLRCLAASADDFGRTEGGLMLRDFQSRNVMIKDDEPYLIDYQGARMGPLAYDLASFLYQARASFGEPQRKRLVKIYADAAGTDFDGLYSRVRTMALLRALQTLGAYGLRGLVQGKGHFVKSIPAALDNLPSLLDSPYADDYLRELLTAVAADRRLCPAESKPHEGVLTVRIMSFSFKQGIPADSGGNGGGFVFDCRAMDNPGRYESLRRYTGLDLPVRKFLEEKGEMQEFLRACWLLTDRSVENYLERRFTDLFVAFGCTGGRHRSVYAAQQTASHLKKLFPELRILLQHRAQQIYTEL